MPKSATEFLFEPTPHDEAAEFIASKPVVARDVYNQLLPELKARAFTIAGIESANVVQDIRDTIATLPQGGDWSKIKKQLVDELHPFLANPENPDNTAAAERRAELLIRTHGFQAYQASSYAVMDRQRDAFPFWQYLSMQDGRVRHTHAALDGKVLPADHPFWDTHFPPWEWGCRCTAVPLTEADAAEIRAEDAGKPMEERRVLEGPVLDQLAKTGQLHLGPTQIFDVRSAKERGDRDGFHWSPSDLRLPLDQLKARYDAETWASFEAWAKKTSIAENRTVWEWLGGTFRKPGDWPPGIADLVDVKKLGGSTGARLVRDPETGEEFVMKRGASPEHLREEFLADQLYQALGIAVPEAKIFETPDGPVKLARFVKGRTLAEHLKRATPDAREATLARIREHFVADALLGNWDVAGLDLDNILVDSAGVPWRIDNGGSLRFRAQGARKTDAQWADTVGELKTLRDPNVNAQTAKIFGSIDDAEIQRQAKKILEKREDLLALVPADLRDRFAARLADLELRIAPPGEISPKFAQEVVKSRIVGRTYLGDFEHIEDHSILFWQERDASGNPVTRAKLRFTAEGHRAIESAIGDQLRNARPIPGRGPQPVGADSFWPALHAALKTVNHHAGDGKYNPTTMATFEAKAKELEAFKPKTPEEKAMKAAYEKVVAAIQTAVKSQKTTGKFAQYLAEPPKADKTTAKPGDLKVESTELVYTGKIRERGHAREGGSVVTTVSGAYRITDGDVELHFAPWDHNTPYAHRGVATIRIPGDATPEQMQRAVALLKKIGVDARPTPPETKELVYLKKGLSFAKPDGDWREILARDIPDAEKVNELKAWAKSHRLGKLLDSPDYQPDGHGNTWGDGWKAWDRWDLPPAKIRTDLDGYGLIHSVSGSIPAFVESILDGGGQVTNTMERMRLGVPIGSGMSPVQDQGTGGANYFFTRIAAPENVARHRGLVFKIERLSRADAYSFPSDYFGDVRPSGENTHTSDPQKARGKTIADYKRFAKKSGNETIFKNGLHLLDDIELIRTTSPSERQIVLEIFARHGIDTLPDGRKITDIVK